MHPKKLKFLYGTVTNSIITELQCTPCPLL
jgi:hypothetical protein